MKQNELANADPGIPADDSGSEVLPPSLKTTEFNFPIGDPIPLPEVDEDSSSLFERLIDESDLLPVWFLERGAVVQRAVGRVVLTQPHTVRTRSGGFHTFPPGTGWATGFMVSPSLFLTNNHVIEDEAFARKVRAQFNFQLGPDGMELLTESYFPAEGDVFHTNPGLDYTLIRLLPNEDLASAGESANAGDRWGFIPLNDTPLYREDQHFNIVQHPAGRRKEVALQDNELDVLTPSFVRYKTDTEPGSSGSPVFDNLWQLVALHHAGGDQAPDGTWLNNQGVRIDAIIDDLRDHFFDINRQDVLDELGI